MIDLDVSSTLYVLGKKPRNKIFLPHHTVQQLPVFHALVSIQFLICCHDDPYSPIFKNLTLYVYIATVAIHSYCSYI